MISIKQMLGGIGSYQKSAATTTPLITIALLIVAFHTASSQTIMWEKQFGSFGSSTDEARAMALDTLGRVYVTGFSGATGSLTACLAPSGDTLWTRSYTGGRFRHICVANGRVLVAGDTPGAGEDYAVVCYDLDGNFKWSDTYNGPGDGEDHVRSIALDSKGQAYVFGDSDRGLEDDDFLTIKYKENGLRAWVHRWDGPSNITEEESAEDIEVDTFGNVYVTGSAAGAGDSSGLDFVVHQYDSLGNENWIWWWDGGDKVRDMSTRLALSGDSIIVAGIASRPGSSCFGCSDPVVHMLGPSGNRIWTARYPLTYPLSMSPSISLGVDSNRSVVIGGTVIDQSTFQVAEWRFCKYYTNGDFHWTKSRSIGSFGSGMLAMDVGVLGDLFAAGEQGYFDGTNIVNRFLIYSVNPSGTQDWTLISNPAGDTNKFTYDIRRGRSGDLYVAGYADSSYSSSSDFLVVKLIYVCCNGSTGNIDCDPSEGVDISDLTTLIDYLYINFQPLCCSEEANVDGSAGVDISDITALIDYLYISFSPPATCQ